MVRYKEDKSPVAIYTPEQITGVLGKADGSLIPFLAIGAFAGVRTAAMIRLAGTFWSRASMTSSPS